MKKLMACLLAVLLLSQPLAAWCEGAQSLTITLETDATRLSPLASALTGEENTALCKDLASLLSSFVLESRWQEDATACVISLQGETILESAVAYDDDHACITSSLLPGYAVRMPLTEGIDWSALAEADWTEELTALGEQVDTLLESLERTEETGRFMGDAYEGGAYRVTYRLDDRTVYLLAECILDTLEKSGQLLEVTGMQSGEFCEAVAELRSWLLPAALENVYRYQLSFVYTEWDSLMGISLTSLEGDKQISTLSIGLMEDGLEIVWGYGRDGVNDYIRLLMLTEPSEEGALNLGLRLSVLEDPLHVGYSLVSVLDNATVEDHILSIAVYPTEEGYIFSGEYEFITPAESLILTADGTCALDPFALEAAVDVYLPEQDESLMTLYLTTGACEDITVETAALTTVDYDAMDEETADTLDQVMIRASTELGMKLLFMLPSDLLRLLIQ
ncbi:MAG: hypothetical protein ACI4O7_07050 [Aristaeellaceae bacterium]